MSVDDAQVPAAWQEETWVCPDCGQPPGDQTFCAGCGVNLSAVTRLPTRADWEREHRVRSRPLGPEIAAALDAMAPLTPMRPADGQTQPTVISAIVSAITVVLPAGARGLPVSAEIVDAQGDTVTDAVARIVLADGALIETPFAVWVPPNSARLKIALDGPAVLVADGERSALPMPERTPAAAAPAASMSRADQAELAARRARDAQAEARLHGWKPLTLWYTGWALLLVIVAIVAFSSDGALGGLVALLFAAGSGKYAHYLYNGGRRRVWFVFW
jgi:hypothetical protein